MIPLTAPHAPINMPGIITTMNVIKAGCVRCGESPSAVSKIDDPHIKAHKPAAPRIPMSIEATSAMKSKKQMINLVINAW